jgi:uncharacterized protein
MREPRQLSIAGAEGTGGAARAFMLASSPRSPDIHLFESDGQHHLFVANGSRIFDIKPALFAQLGAAIATGQVDEVLARVGVANPLLIDDRPLEPPPIHTLSLAVAQKCNLGCTYCYAQQGEFGGAAKNMPLETANQAVDLLLSEAGDGGKAVLAFLGGEPMVNRPVVQAVTQRAAALARRRNIALSFSITTNGTLLTAADAAFFENYGFAVTISLDGPREAHDRLRPYKSGAGSFDRIMRNLAPLLASQRRMQISARVTVTPENLDLRRTLDGFIAAGFHSVGFSPMLNAPSGRGEMQAGDLVHMLDGMIDCGRAFEQRLVAGERYPFDNMVNAMREIHRGTHRPYPCGAGAGYLGVSADGELAACHRFVGDEEGAMGTLGGGVDRVRQSRWLAERHVHRQAPCTECWARYLCGGGCHHEAIGRGRPACDYIRGWLHYCMSAYLRLSRTCPAWFEEAPAASGQVS